MKSRPDDTYIGLGANLGDAVRTLREALVACESIPWTRVVSCSSFYRSAPLGYADQPDFVNAVARLTTGLSAREVLDHLHAIETHFGRTREFLNAPRTLDLDLLLHGQERISLQGLEVPHPRMHQRRFVLEPLAELVPGLQVAGRGRVADLLRACTDQPVHRIGAR